MIRACEPPRTLEVCATAFIDTLPTPFVLYGGLLRTPFLAGLEGQRAHAFACPRTRGSGWGLGCVVLVGTGEFFEAEDHVLQGLHVRYLAYVRGLELSQQRLDGLRVEPFGDGVQSRNAACCGFEHLQDGSLHGGILDQLRLVDAPVLAKHVAVQHGADNLFQAQNARIQIVAVASARAVFAVSGVSVAVAGSLSGVAPVGLASSIRAVGRAGGATVTTPARRSHSFTPVLRKRPGEQRGCSHWLAVLIQINPNGLDIIEIPAKTKARTRPLECLGIG